MMTNVFGSSQVSSMVPHVSLVLFLEKELNQNSVYIYIYIYIESSARK